MTAKKVVVAAGLLLWCGVVGGDRIGVAYHRICCLQEDDVEIARAEEDASFVSVVRDIVNQFDSNFCIHNFGYGDSTGDNSGVWPRAVHTRTQAFEREHKSMRRRKSGHRAQSRNRDGQAKCATVDVFFEGTDYPLCPLDFFTPQCIHGIAKKIPEVRIGTGQGKWDGRSIFDYVEDEIHFKRQLESDEERPLISDSFLNGIVTSELLEKELQTYVDASEARGVFRFLEYATNSRALSLEETRNFVFEDEVEHVMTVGKLKDLRHKFTYVLDSICQRVGSRDTDEKCLQAVPVGWLTPSFERLHDADTSETGSRHSDPREGKIEWNAVLKSYKSRSRSKQKTETYRETVDLTVLYLRPEVLGSLLGNTTDEAQKTVANALHIYSPSQHLARVMDYVLIKGFFAASKTSYVDVFNRVMQQRLSSEEFWMVVACAEELDFRPSEKPKNILDSYFRFSFVGKGARAYYRTGALGDIDTTGLKTPTCAVLADLPGSAYRGSMHLLIAHFKRDERGKDKVMRSAAGWADPCKFFNGRRGNVDEMFRESAGRIQASNKSPPLGLDVGKQTSSQLTIHR